MYVSECFNCDKIDLKLSNTAASHQGSRSGSYQESTLVNGKQSWISNSGNAIWWISSSGQWAIGSASGIGGTIGGLFSNDPSNPDSECPQQVSKWNVWNGNGFTGVDSTEVLFTCPESAGIFMRAEKHVGNWNFDIEDF